MVGVIFSAFAVLAFTIAFVISAWSYFYFNCYYGFFSQKGILRHGPVNKKNIAITFDDGPSEYTEKILDILKDKKIKATFFIIGKCAQQHPDIVKRIVKEGHEIGNHSFSHSRLYFRTKAFIDVQIKKTEEAIKKITGKRTKYFRPPNGRYTQKLRNIMVKNDYKIILWTISSHDWRNPGVNKIIDKSTKYLRNGDILLFHDGGSVLKHFWIRREQTIKSLPEVINRIKEKKLKPVIISKLLKND